MTETFQILILLMVVISAVAVVARRLEVPPAILLVITGVGLALIPGLPTPQLAPDLVLVLVLPPVIYWSAVKMSWREFRFNLRPITLLALGCVVFTTVAVAAATHWLLGFPWPVGFVLGAIVSPPDPVAPLAIAQRLQIPKRLLVILEGEGLANDATALVLYRFAVSAVSVGSFSFGEAVGSLAAIVGCEIVWGIGAGWLMLRLRRWVREPGVEIMLSILTPFVAYWPPERLGGTGVLATVAAGLYVSWNGPRLIPAATRLQGVAALAHSCDPTQRSVAAVAVAVPTGVHRGPRHRLADGGARDPLYDRRRKPVSGAQPDPVSDILRDFRDVGRPRLDTACRDPRAWSRPCRTSRTTGREKRRVEGP